MIIPPNNGWDNLKNGTIFENNCQILRRYLQSFVVVLV